MIRDYAVIRSAAQHAGAAAARALDSLRDGRVEQEPAFTDRMLARIEHELEGLTTKSVVWRAKTLTDRGRGSQEHRYGADFLGVLHIDLPEFTVRKGFLAQAKLLKADGPNRHDPLLQRQCKDMLRLSPSSFVFLYSQEGIQVVPALSVLAVQEATDLRSLYSRSVSRFFEDHFASFIGDQRLSDPHIHTLDQLAQAHEVRSAIEVRASLASAG